MHYLIMEDFSGNPAVFIFPERVDHADMRGQLPYGSILGCGSMKMENGGIQCGGGNAELGMQAKPEDARIIAEALKK